MINNFSFENVDVNLLVTEFGENASRAVRENLNSEKTLEELLFPVWTEFIHKVFMQAGICPCIKENEDSNLCFEKLPREEKIKTGGYYHSFEDMLNEFKEAWDLFCKNGEGGVFA